jgi:aspartate kinase
MSVIVAKFGGTSVASPDCIRHAAQRIEVDVRAGHKVVVVVSAVAGETNRLLELTRKLSQTPNDREVDVVVSSGEQVACGLMAIALQELGLKAQSCLGWQLPITTSAHHSKARLRSVKSEVLEQLLAQNIIPVIAGFQGVTADGDLTTFGRGGSDLTAVAVAAALNAEYCCLFKDVDGIFSADPRIVEQAQLLKELTYEEMLELSSLGSKVIQPRAVEAAIAFDVNLLIKPTFGEGGGTKIIKERSIKEQHHITGLVCNRGEIKICLKNTPVSPSIAARLFEALSNAHIIVDMIIQNGLLEGQDKDDLTFTLAQEDASQAVSIAKELKPSLGFRDIIVSERVAKISLVGAGMRGHACVAHKLFDTLARNGISVHGVSTSEIKVSVLVSSDYADLALKSLHKAFELDMEDLSDDQSKTTAA